MDNFLLTTSAGRIVYATAVVVTVVIGAFHFIRFSRGLYVVVKSMKQPIPTKVALLFPFGGLLFPDSLHEKALDYRKQCLRSVPWLLAVAVMVVFLSKFKTG